jgi:hypothetical protein
VDVLRPLLAPKIAFVNPALGAVVALPKGEIAITFDQDMLGGTGANSVMNLANYTLTGTNRGVVPVKSVQYDAATRTVRL